MPQTFYRIRGINKGGERIDGTIVFENQVGTAVLRLLTRPDLIRVEVECSNVHDWKKQQQKKKEGSQ